jgi:hypothetical protein
MKYSENISAVFPRISAILGGWNASLRKVSDGEYVWEEHACPAWCFGKIPDPKTGVLFPLTLLSLKPP